MKNLKNLDFSSLEVNCKRFCCHHSRNHKPVILISENRGRGPYISVGEALRLLGCDDE